MLFSLGAACPCFQWRDADSGWRSAGTSIAPLAGAATFMPLYRARLRPLGFGAGTEGHALTVQDSGARVYGPEVQKRDSSRTMAEGTLPVVDFPGRHFLESLLVSAQDFPPFRVRQARPDPVVPDQEQNDVLEANPGRWEMNPVRCLDVQMGVSDAGIKRMPVIGEELVLVAGLIQQSIAIFLRLRLELALGTRDRNRAEDLGNREVVDDSIASHDFRVRLVKGFV